MSKINLFAQKIVIFPIVLYRYLLKPFIKPCCRYYPSCSLYALEAIAHFGIVKGAWRTLCRILRCHPWSAGGYDPILPNKETF